MRQDIPGFGAQVLIVYYLLYSVLAVYEALNDMNQKYIAPLSKVIDRMLILLMGDVYDREFTAEELIPYGYPVVSAEELKKMEKDDELPF